jgi:alpha-ketoglutarate-dependent taurine dioxygenase
MRFSGRASLGFHRSPWLGQTRTLFTHPGKVVDAKMVPRIGGRLPNSYSGNRSSSLQVTLSTSTGIQKPIVLPVEWVLDNHSGIRHRTGQRISGLLERYPILDALPQMVSVERVQQPSTSSNGLDSSSTEPGKLQIELSDGMTVFLEEAHILKYATRSVSETSQSQDRGPLRAFTKVHPSVTADVPHVDFSEFVKPESHASNTPQSAFGKAMTDLAEYGLIIVDGCPPDPAADSGEPPTVVKIARRIDVEQHTLYGTHWSVQSAPTEGPKNNVAYTAEYLDYHHDLVYYQSPPGLQLLHCAKFDSCVTGGESLFIDGFMIAEELRRRNPEAFQTLVEVPAAFMKDDLSRKVPAQFYYATPHIHVNHLGAITEMRWAPAFEAPLSAMDPEKIVQYYHAKAEFVKVLTDLRESRQLRFRLKPGQTVVFQQTRVLHGREAFTEPTPNSRVFRGCYVNIDAFWNQVSVQVNRLSPGAFPTIARGNRSYY